jgi:predicted RNA-binding protein with PIN domain
MANPEPGAHRRSPRWQQALEIAEAAVRLAPTEPAHRVIAVQLADAAAAVPAAAARVEHGEPVKLLGQALLKLEASVLLAQRLGAVPEAKASAVVARIDGFRSPTPSAPAQVEAPAGGEVPKLAARPAPQTVPARPASRPTQPAAAPERLFVDGSNFLGRAPGYALGDAGSRDRLTFRLQDYVRRHPAHKVTVFFDGQKTASRNLGGVEERVTSGLHEADDVIVDSVRALPTADRRRCIVVTDDRTLASRVRGEGVRVESVAWLSARFVAPATSAVTHDPGIPRDELSDWEDFFKKPPQRPGR